MRVLLLLLFFVSNLAFSQSFTKLESRNILKNGSFEFGHSLDTNKNGWKLVSEIEGWKSDESIGESFELQSLNTGSITPSNGYVKIELDGRRNSEIYQNVELEVGKEYELYFDYTARTSNVTTNGVSAHLNNVEVLLVEGSQIAWKTYKYSFVADADIVRVSFRGEGTSDGIGGVIDNIKLVEKKANFSGNLLLNSSFEDLHNLGWNKWKLFNEYGAWKRTEAEIVVPFEVQEGGTAGISAYDGNHKIELDSSRNGNVVQDVVVTPNELMTLSVYYTPRALSRGLSNEVTVYIDNIEIGKLYHDVKEWREYTFDITPQNEEIKVELRATGKSDGIGGLIDFVSLKDRAGKEYIINGSFENGLEKLIPKRTWHYALFLNNGNDWYASLKANLLNPIEVLNGNKIGGVTPREGTAKSELDSRGNARIYQDVQTSASENYLLSFSYSPRRPNDVTNEVEVFWNGEKVTRLTADLKGWSDHQYIVNGIDGLSRVEFLGAGVSDSLGAYIDRVLLQKIEVPIPPVADFSTSFLDDKLILDASSSKDDLGIISYQWRIDGPTLIQTQNPVLEYDAERGNIYGVSLTVTSSSGLSSYIYRKIEVPDNGEPTVIEENKGTGGLDPTEPLKPFAYAELSSFTAYIGEDVTFNASESFSYTGVITNYKWDLGNGEIYNTTEPEFIYAYSEAREFYPILTITDDQNKTSSYAISSVDIVGQVEPKASLVASSIEGRVPFSVQFDASGTTPADKVKEYHFFFGDGGYIQSEVPIVNHTYLKEGAVEAKVIAILEEPLEGEIQTTLNLNVLERDDPPVTNLIASVLRGKLPLNVQFDGSLSFDDHGIENYEWDFGDGSPASSGTTQSAVSHTFTTPGVYSVKMLITDSIGQQTEENVEIEVVGTPAHLGDFTITSSGTHYPQTLVLDARVSNDEIYKYEWTVNGQTFVRYNPVMFYDALVPGEVSVTLKVSTLFSNETHTKTKTINLNSEYLNLNFLASTETTVAGSVVNYALQGPMFPSYRWHFGDGFVEETASREISHFYKSGTEYTVRVEGLDENGVAQSKSHIIILAPNKRPVVSFIQNKLQGEAPFTLNIDSFLNLDDEKIESLILDWGDGSPIISVTDNFSLIHTYEEKGNYKITLVGKDRDDQVSKTEHFVTVHGADFVPTASFEVDRDFGNPHLVVNFDASKSKDDFNIESYEWLFEGGVKKTTNTPLTTYTYTRPGIYTVQLTVKDEKGQSFTSEKMIRVNAHPVASLNITVDGEEKPFNLKLDSSATTDDADGLSYKWFLQDGTVLAESTNPIANIILDRDGMQSIFVEVTDSDGYISKRSALVKLNTPPVARGYVSPMIANFPVSISYDGTASFDDSIGLIYKWSLNGVEISTDPMGDLNFDEAGMHLLELEVTDFEGLVSQANFPITIQGNPDPVSSFTYELARTVHPTKAKFDASISSDDKSIVNYNWKVGETTPVNSTSPKFSFDFTTAGDFPVTLTVTDNQGATHASTQTVTINPNQIPVASLLASTTSGELPLVIEFNASNSTDDDKLTYSFDFMDGSTFVSDQGVASHTFNTAGSYDVQVTVTDLAGQSATQNVTITVNDPTKTDTELPQVIPVDPSDYLTSDQVSVRFSLYDNTGINYDHLEIYRDSSLLDPSHYTVDTNNNTVDINFGVGNDLNIGDLVTYSLRVTDTEGNYTARAFPYLVVNEITPDMMGPVFNFHPGGGQLSSTEVEVDIFVSDKSGIDFSNLEIKLNGDVVDPAHYVANETQGKIDLSFTASFPLPEENFNLIEVMAQDSLGNVGVGLLGLDTKNDEVTIIDTNVLTQALSDAGNRFSCFKLVGGDVKCFGENSSGQLGLGHINRVGLTSGFRAGGSVADSVPSSIGGKALKVSIGGVSNHVCALLEGGQARCWGSNTIGQLGLGHTNNIGDDELPEITTALSFGTEITEIDVMNQHNCAIYDGGKLKCWGLNNSGQLGIGSTQNQGDDEDLTTLPDVNIGGNVIQVVGGLSHTCALLEDKTVRCWGSNGAGQLGIGNTANIGDNEDPATTSALNFGRTDIVKLAGGDNHTCALFETGEVKCWGRNGFGELGLAGTANYRSIPVNNIPYVDIGGNAVNIFSGRYQTCVILDNGNARCWGLNSFGMLGLGHTDTIGDNEHPSSTAEIDFTDDIVTMTAGEGHTCAFFSDNKAKCWGLNNLGQLGVDVTSDITVESYADAQYLGITDEVDSNVDSGNQVYDVLSYGGYLFSCFQLESENVKCFGDNRQGQLGIGNTTNVGNPNSGIAMSAAPNAEVGGPTKSVSAGFAHACVLMKDGNVRCFGNNAVGQLGLGHTDNIGDDELPSSVAALDFGGSATKVVSKLNHTCVVYGTDNKLKCFGQNNYGQLGNLSNTAIGDDENVSAGIDADLGDGVLQVTTGSEHTCALLESGDVRCFGRNNYGQAGFGNTSLLIGDDEAPKDVAVIDFGSDTVSKIDAGESFTCALLDNQKVKCFGRNEAGQLGQGNTTNSDNTEPKDIPYISLGKDALDIAVGFNHACALLVDGTAKCWGSNAFAQLGTGDKISLGDNELPSSNNSYISFADPIVRIEAGLGHTCALFADKTARCFGLNNLGQLGTDITESVVGDNEAIDAAGTVLVSDIDLGDFIEAPQATIVAIINATPFFGSSPLNVNFDGSGSTSTAGAISTYAWDFGDGNTGSGATVSHTYNAVGVYRVKLTVTDDAGSSTETETAITVSQDAILPIAKFTKDKEFAIENEAITLDASTSSYVKENTPNFEYIWTFSDGTTQTTTTSAITKAFVNEGVYTISLKVKSTTDNEESSVYREAIVVKPDNYKPEGELACTPSGYDLSCSMSDLRDRDGKIAKIVWNMGDNTTLTGESVNHTYAQDGTGKFDISVSVIDDKGESSSYTYSFNPDTTAPQIASNILADQTVLESKLDFTLDITDENRTVTEIYVNDELRVTSTDKTINNYLVLETGVNEVKVVSRDLAGNFAPEVVYSNITVEDKAPEITILNSDNVLTNQSNMALNILVSDEGVTKTSIIVNNEIILQDSTLTDINQNITLFEGTNFIQVISFDDKGQASLATLSDIKLDTVAPIITLENPEDGGFFRGTNKVNFKGDVSEAVTVLSINGEAITMSGNSFEYTKEFLSEGEQNVIVTASDSAGNVGTSEVTINVASHIIYKELITIVPFGNRLRVVGKEGATRFPFQKVKISSGLFSSTEVESNNFGAFEAVIDTTPSVNISARYNLWDFDEEFTVFYNVDSAFSGIVKDVDDNPLPNVVVRFVGSDQSVTTGIDGVFHFEKPPLGRQTVEIDAVSVPENYDNSGITKKFSKTILDVNLGLNQNNVLDKIVYLTPIILDGTETRVIAGQAANVRKMTTSGLVEIDIPVDTAIFPEGTEVEVALGEFANVISVSEISIDKTSVPKYEPAHPKSSLFALEPSGLQFSNRVRVSLPNRNEFPDGTRVVFVSKNSKTGHWEIDGAGKAQGDRVVTDPGLGISHFSNLYVVPYGLNIRNFRRSDQPGIDATTNGVSNVIKMPSFKLLNNNIQPSLIYNSSWAKPTGIVSNVFDLSDQQIELSEDETTQTNSDNGFIVGTDVEVENEAWAIPEKVYSTFYIDGIEYEEAEFNITNKPEEAIVSYGVNLSDLKSGYYNTRASYRIEYKGLLIQTVTTQNNYLGGLITSGKDKSVNEIEIDVEDVIPSDVDSFIAVQNKSDSEFGRGWKLGLTQEIINPESDRLLIEEVDGNITQYALNDTIETIHYDPYGIKSFSFNVSSSNSGFNNVDTLNFQYFSGDGWIYTVRGEQKLNNDNNPYIEYKPSQEVELTRHQGEIAVNMTYRTRKEFKYHTTVGGFKAGRYWKHHYRCEYGTYPFNLVKDVAAMYAEGEDKFMYLDRQGALYRYDNSSSEGPEVLLSGLLGAPPEIRVSNVHGRPNVEEHCNRQIRSSCGVGDRGEAYYNVYRSHKTNGDSSSEKDWTPSHGRCKIAVDPSVTSYTKYITPYASSTGLIPQKNYGNSSLKEAIFNNPEGMAISKLDSNIIYIADTGNNVVREINLTANTIKDFAGNRSTHIDREVSGYIDPLSVSIVGPRGVAVDRVGNVYISSSDGMIRKVDTSNRMKIIAGRTPDQVPNVSRDNLQKVLLRNPSGLAMDDSDGRQILYVADRDNNRILRLNLSSGEERATQIAGTGRKNCSTDPESTGEGRLASSVDLCSPDKIALDTKGNLLFLDKKDRVAGFNENEEDEPLRDPVTGREINKSSVPYTMIRRVNFSYLNDGKLTYASVNGGGDKIVKEAGGNFTLTKRNQVVNTFNVKGKHLSQIDQFGNGATFEYSDDLLKNIVFKVGDNSHVATLNYSNGKLISFIDPVGRETKFDIDSSDGQLLEVETTQGTSNLAVPTSENFSTLRSFTYYPENGLMSSFSDERNNVTSYFYSKQFQRERISRPDGSTVTYVGGIEDTIANAAGEDIIDLKSYDAESEESAELRDFYKDPNGVRTELNLDTFGYIKTIVTKDDEGNDREIRIERDSFGRPLSIEKLYGDYEKTVYAYNEYGETILTHDTVADKATEYTYNSFGSLELEETFEDYSTSNPKLINRERKAFDPIKNYELASFDFFNNEIRKSYYIDGENGGYPGQLKTVTKVVREGVDEVTKVEYFVESGNLKRKTLPGDVSLEYIEDDAGNVEKKINGRGVEFHYSYDFLNRLISIKTGVVPTEVTNNGEVLQVSEGKETLYEYTNTGKISKIIDPLSNVTKFSYNNMDYVSKKETPNGQVFEYLLYNPEGNVLKEKTPNGDFIDYKYNLAGLLTEKILPDNHYVLTYEKDSENLLSVSDNDSKVEFSYEKKDERYVVKSTTVSGEAYGGETRVITFENDNEGNRTLMIANFIGGSNSITYNRNQGGRIDSITNHLGENFNFAYQENRLVGINRIDKIFTKYNYSERGLLKDIIDSKDEAGSNKLSHLMFRYDNTSNLIEIDDGSSKKSFGYDSQSHLVSASNPSISGDYMNESFSYDSLGNRSTDQFGNYYYDETTPGDETTLTGVTTAQRLTSDYKNLYFYDSNGNLTSIQERGINGNYKNFVYSSDNQLIEVNEYKNNVHIKKVSYLYDALRRRTSKKIENLEDLNQNYTRYYVYHDEEILAEFDESNDILGVYTHSNLRIDDVLSVDVKSTKLAQTVGSYFYLKDRNGSVTQILDSSANVVQKHEYSAFGKTLKITNQGNIVSFENSFIKSSYGYTNREFDEETGMLYYRSRYYMPEIGRFISEDNAPGELMVPESFINKYIYTLNNPLSFTDPTGDIPVLIPFLVKIGAFVGKALVATVVSSAIGIGLDVAVGGIGFDTAVKNAITGFGTNFVSSLFGLGALKIYKNTFGVAQTYWRKVAQNLFVGFFAAVGTIVGAGLQGRDGSKNFSAGGFLQSALLDAFKYGFIFKLISPANAYGASTPSSRRGSIQILPSGATLEHEAY